MHAARLTSSAQEQGPSAVNGATIQRRRWEPTYTAVSWDYPPSPAAYYDALLSRGASHSRFLRIAYWSTRERAGSFAPPSPISLSPPFPASSLDTPTSPSALSDLALATSPASSPRKPAGHLPSIPPCPLSRPCVNTRPRSANPTLHTLKRRQPQWPKPPHYHASLLRSPLSRRKGLFRAVLSPNKAVDFFRWDILLGANVSLSVPCQERDRTRTGDADACASLLVAESVLEPYEAAAGFFGWHGLGLGIAGRVQKKCSESMEGERYWVEGIEVCRLGHERDGARLSRLSGSQLEVDEAVVEEGRARWALTAQELVGPPGLALRRVAGDREPGKASTPSRSVRKDVLDSRVPLSMYSRREEVRWGPDVDSGASRPSRPTSAFDEKRQSPLSSSAATVLGSSSGSKPELKTDLPSVWWHGPSPHHPPPSTPHLPSPPFPPPPSVQCGSQLLQFSPWISPGCVASAQGHGFWCTAQPNGELSSISRDSNLPKSIPSHSNIFATPTIPTSGHPSRSPRHLVNSNVSRNEYGLTLGYEKETETDYGYESTTTTTDSDPLPHTPVGAATTSHCVEAFQVHGDDEMEVHGIETDTERAAVSISIGLSDPTTPVKLLGRFPMSASSSLSSSSPGPNQDGRGSSKAAVVFPSLNGSFRQGSLPQMSLCRGTSAHTTPANSVTPVTSSSLSSTKQLTTQLGLGNEDDDTRVKPESGGACPVSGDNPLFILDLCSPLPTSPSSGLRKDSQGFWEPVTPISPSSSSSSLPHSLSEGKIMSRPTAGWIGEKTGSVLGESFESSEAASSQFTLSAKSRSLSPGPRRVTSAESTRSSSSRPASYSYSASTPGSTTSAFGGSYPSSPSPVNNSSLVSLNPTTLLPAFLATATVKRKKGSRTREIVDRLRSSSIDAGKEGAALDGLSWLASPGTGGVLDGTLGEASSVSDHAIGDHAARDQPSPSPASESNPDSASWLGPDPEMKIHDQTSKPSDSGSSVLARKSSGTTQIVVRSSEAPISIASPRTGTSTAKPSITPFPILTVSQSSASNFTTTHQSQNGGAAGHLAVTATPSNGTGGIKVNASVASSSNARSPGLLPLPSTPNGGISSPTHHSHYPLASLSHPTAHSKSPLGVPPPALTVSPYPHPMYVPVTQYHLAPPHQVQQGQGIWLAAYPGRPPHLPVHHLPAQVHVPTITGASGMRHVSW